jgi:hypothetical protein
MRFPTILALGAALVASPVLAAPAPKAAPKASAATGNGTQAPPQVQDAMLYLKVLISALQSDTIEQPIKGALVGCLYNDSLGAITENMGKLIAQNPGKVSRDNPSQVLSAMLAVCGYRPEDAPAKPGAAAPAPKAAPAGR